MNGPGPADFIALAKYAHDLVKRIQSLGDDDQTLRARAGVLSLLFSELHTALLKCDNLTQKHDRVFADLRMSCYTTLSNIDPTIKKLEALKSKSTLGRNVKKVMFAVQNKMDKLNAELRDQTVLLSLLVIYIKDMFADASRRTENTDLLKKIDILTAQMASFRLEISQPGGQNLQLDAIERVSVQLQQLAPRELTFDIKDIFGDFISHHQLIQEPFARRRPVLLESETSNFRSPQAATYGDDVSWGYSQYEESNGDSADNKEETDYEAPDYEDNNENMDSSDRSDSDTWQGEPRGNGRGGLIATSGVLVLGAAIWVGMKVMRG